MSYKWISPQGEIVTTKTIAEWARTNSVRYSNAKSLACGSRQTVRGWLSPKAPKKRRKRFMTVLRNVRTGESAIVGKSIRSFATAHGVCHNDLCAVVAGKKIAAKGWILERSAELALTNTAEVYF